MWKVTYCFWFSAPHVIAYESSTIFVLMDTRRRGVHEGGERNSFFWGEGSTGITFSSRWK